MNEQVEIIIILFFGLTLLYVLPLVVPLANAAQIESGVEIIAPTTTETEKICDDTIDNDDDNGKIDGDDQDCVAGPKRPPAEIAEICGNGNDQDCVVAPADPARGTCGLQILDGVPINYGYWHNPEWTSANMRVNIKNAGTINAEILVKGGNWVSDAAGNPIVSGPDITRVSIPSYWDLNDTTTNPYVYDNKISLQSNGIKLATISPEKDIQLLFQIKLVPLMLEGGSFHQEVSIDLLCGGNEFLKEDETKGDHNTSAKTSNTPSPVPIPYPDTNNTTTGMQIRAE